MADRRTGIENSDADDSDQTVQTSVERRRVTAQSFVSDVIVNYIWGGRWSWLALIVLLTLFGAVPGKQELDYAFFNAIKLVAIFIVITAALGYFAKKYPVFRIILFVAIIALGGLYLMYELPRRF